MKYKVGDFVEYRVPTTTTIRQAIVLKVYDNRMDVFWLSTGSIGLHYFQNAPGFKMVGG